MTDLVCQEIEQSRISLSQDDVCGIMAAADEVLTQGVTVKGQAGKKLLRVAERIEEIIYNGTYEPGGKHARS